ncbi:MAG TPA: acyl-CoA thioesterase [Pseudomonadales bacterium]|nr:acyl-CoA thioesterase [Pseudomonadales bacterium]
MQTEIEIEVPFHDVDIMGVVWHGHYVKYLEIARCALLDQIDYNYPQMKASGYAWPVIDMRIRYPQPLYFRQRIRVRANLEEWELRLKIGYLIEDAETGRRMTRAYTVQVALDMKSGEMLLASPEVLYEKLGIEP